MATRIVAPLTGTVAKGSWFTNQSITVGAMPNGFMRYNYLLPQGYNPSTFIYPILFYGHENDEGMNGNSYPSDGGGLVNQTVIDGSFNTIAFRTNFPCIVVVPHCDQSIDTSGANGNANFGGYADSPNSGGNEQAINALLNFFISNFAVDTTRCYATGDSLGAIGALAWIIDNNTVNGSLKLWTAAMGFSDQLFRQGANSAGSVFSRMANVPYIAVGTPNDNNEQIYDQAAWQSYTGNSNYPSPSTYSSGGAAALRAASTSYYYMHTTNDVPWDTYRQLNADGGQGTSLYNLLFSFTSGTPTPTPPTPTPPTPTPPTPTPPTPTPTPTGAIRITPGSGSFTDGSGNVYSIDASSNAIENGSPITGGAGTSAMELYNGVVYAQDANSGSWYTWDQSNFNGPVTAPPTPTPTPPTPTPTPPTPTPTPPTPTPPTPTPTPPTPTPTPGKTNWYENPGQDGMFWKLPFQTTAQWTTSGAEVNTLRQGSGWVHLPGDYSVPWVIGRATDPLITIIDGSGRHANIQVRIPLGTQTELPITGVDNGLGGADTTQPYLCWTAESATMSTTTVQAGTVITAHNGLALDAGNGPIMLDAVTGQPGTGNCFGTIQDFELTKANADPNYVIQHMLAYEMDSSQMNSQPAIWPLAVIDTSFPNTGGMTQGHTIGIPASVPMPAGLTRGGKLLWNVFQQFGAFFYNVSGNSTISFGCYWTTPANQALANDIKNSFSQIVPNLCILANQTGLSSQKGMVNGVRSDAFPAPPLLDLSPTGGVETAPSTVGAFWPSGYNVTPVAPAPTPFFTIVTPTQKNAGAAFTVTGTISGYSAAPTMNYRNDSGSFVALPTGFSVSATTFSFTNPGLPAGTHTITVRDANNTAVAVSTSSFSVVAVITPVVTPVAPSFPAAGQPFTLSGTLANYAAAPSLTYSDNGGVPTSFPGGSTISATAFSFVHPGIAAGSYTTAISDGTNSGQIGYSVTAITGGASPNLTTITPGSGSFNDAAGVRWSISASGRVVANGIVDGTTSSVVEMAWVSPTIWYENSSGLWFSKAAAANAWSSPGTTVSPLTNLPTVSITAIPSPTPNTPFQVTGSLSNFTAIPTLNYSDSGAPASAFPAGSQVTISSFTFTHPGLAAGNYTLAVSNGTYSGTASFSVVAQSFTSLPSTTNLTNTITGLTPGTIYDIQVYATNSVGQGPPSAILSVTTSAAAIIVPSTPTGLTSTSKTTTTVTLSWVASATGTQPITYQVQYSFAGANSWSTGPSGSATTAQVTGLSAQTNYDFRVSAGNTQGTSAFSAVYTTATNAIVAATVTWQPTGVVGPLTLSNGNLTATAGGTATAYSAQQSCVSTTSIASGKVSFEVTMSGVSQNCSIGLAGLTHALATDAGGDALSIGYYMSTGASSQPAQTMYYNNNQALSPSGNAPAADTNGAVIAVCVDVSAGQWWVTSPAMRSAYGSTAWNDSSSANPATGTGGVPFTISGPVLIVFSTNESGGIAVLNAGSSPFATSFIPSSFPAWSGSNSTVTAPGQVSGLTAGAVSNTSVALSWTAPSGTPPFTYNVLQALHGTGSFGSGSSAPNPLIIMPMGDSVTAGGGTAVNGGPPPGAYRGQLYTLLTSAGYTIQLVGDQTNNPGGGLPSNQVGHEGFGGYTIEQLQSYVQSNNILTRYTPNVILLLIGSNDLFANSDSDQFTFNLLVTFCQYILSTLPAVHLVVATLQPQGPPGSSSEQDARGYDDLIINSLVSTIGGNRVSTVDVDANSTYAADIGPDGVHPNVAGNQIIANLYGAAVKAIYSQSATTTSNTSITITGLTASTSYDFVVFASNSAGNGANSAIVNAVTSATLTVPGAVVGVSAGTPTTTSVPLSWQPNTTGSPSTSYQVQYKLATASTYTSFSPTTTGLSQTVTGLTANTAYNFRVYGINSAGNGTPSSPAISVTTAATSAPSSGPAAVLALFNSYKGTHAMSCQFTEIQGLAQTQSGGAIDAIHSNTGQYLGMIGGDYWWFGSTSATADTTYNAAAIQWWNAGGLITMSFSMPNPTTGGYVGDVSNLDAAGILTSGTSTNTALLTALSSAAAGIAALQTAGVTIIFRPFHENNGNWFWWGTNFLSTSQFAQLWQFVYNYMTNTKGLKNIVWLFSVNAGISNYSQTIPRYNAIMALGNYIDITGFDLYTSNPDDGIADYNTLNGLGKLVCLCEYGPGTPSSGDSSFNEQTLINTLKTSMKNIVFWQQWWAPWGIGNCQNGSGALNDPWVLNRGEFALTTTPPTPTPPTPTPPTPTPPTPTPPTPTPPTPTPPTPTPPTPTPPTPTPTPSGTPTQVVGSLNVPWQMAFLPDGSFLVTQRDAFSVKHISAAGAVLGTFSVPNTVTTGGEGGLMGLAVDPAFSTNNFIYLCHTRTYSGGYTSGGNEVIRYTLNATANTISAGSILITYGSGQFHNGGGLGIGPDGKLYITTGNGTSPNTTSQVLTGAAINDGKILRINLDGTKPTDNPFNTDGTKAVNGDGKTRSAVWTWGHRNPQGVTWDASGNCWSSENGPTGEAFGSFSGINGNDKINLIVKGINYGFPLTYGPGTATDSFGVTTTAPVFTSGDNEVWAPEGIVFSNGSVFFCALGGLGTPSGTAALDQFKVTGTTPSTGITKRITDSHRKRAAVIGPNSLLYYSTSDGDGRGNQSAGTDVINKVDLSVWTGVPTPTPPTPTPTGNFRVSNGHILGPDGNTWIGKGINIYAEQGSTVSTSSAGLPLLTLFPGLKILRVAFGSYTSATDAALNTFINQMTALKIVMVMEDHSGISATPYTGSQLTTETNWYASMASRFSTNPYVWFGTFNEPGTQNGGSAITTQEVAIYNAIRGAGNNNIVLMELPGGGNPGTIGAGFGMTVSSYATMSNIVWDLHYYGWVSGMSTDQPTVNAALQGSVAAGQGIVAAQTIQSADGLVPVIIGEYGNSTDGNTVDANATQVINAVGNSGLPCMAWHWSPGAPGDVLTVNNNQLTSPYGQQIAAIIAASSTPTPPTPTPPTPTPTPSGTKITPGVGSFTDGSGNVYTIDSGSNALENGSPMAGGAGTSAMEYYNGQVYGQDGNNGSWYTWDQSNWNGPVSAPP